MTIEPGRHDPRLEKMLDARKQQLQAVEVSIRKRVKHERPGRRNFGALNRLQSDWNLGVDIASPDFQLNHGGILTSALPVVSHIARSEYTETIIKSLKKAIGTNTEGNIPLTGYEIAPKENEMIMEWFRYKQVEVDAAIQLGIKMATFDILTSLSPASDGLVFLSRTEAQGMKNATTYTNGTLEVIHPCEITGTELISLYPKATTHPIVGIHLDPIS